MFGKLGKKEAVEAADFVKNQRKNYADLNLLPRESSPRINSGGGNSQAKI
jgi:hypothetical protein